MLQALQQDMAKHGEVNDAVTSLLTIEAAMEAWARAGRPAAALAQADQLFLDSNVLELCPIFDSHDSR